MSFWSCIKSTNDKQNEYEKCAPVLKGLKNKLYRTGDLRSYWQCLNWHSTCFDLDQVTKGQSYFCKKRRNTDSNHCLLHNFSGCLVFLLSASEHSKGLRDRVLSCILNRIEKKGCCLAVNVWDVIAENKPWCRMWIIKAIKRLNLG